MMASKPFALLILLMTGLLLGGCDTPVNVKSPSASYFIKYFGNEGSQTGTDFVVNKDGTFVLFGTTHKANEDPRFYMVKADAKGNVLWEKTFGSAKCQARDIELASDGRIVVLGNMIVPNRTDYDVYLKTFLPDGTPKDSLLKGYPDVITLQPANEDASTVTQTNDGFIVAGSSGNIAHAATPSIVRDPILLRVDDNLVVYTQGVWSVTPSVGRGTENVGTKIVQLPNKTFYFFGYTTFKIGSAPQTDFDFWYFNVGLTGDPAGGEWFLGSPGKDQKLLSVSVDTTSLGTGFFLGGLETDPNGDRIYFTKLIHPPLSFAATDALPIPPNFLGIDLGNLNTILNPPNPSNEFVSVCVARHGFLVLTNEVTAENNNLFLIKIDGRGDPVWTTPIIYGGQGDDFAGSVQELPDGKIVIIGTMTVGQASVNNGETKMVLIKVNQDGQFAD